VPERWYAFGGLLLDLTANHPAREALFMIRHRHKTPMTLMALMALLSASLFIITPVRAQGPAADNGVAASDPVSSASTVTFTTLADFGIGDGEYPNAPLAQGTDGNLYGTTQFGHAPSNGFAFKMATTGGLATLPGYSCTETGCTGDKSYAGLVLAGDGNFYGTTSEGGNGTYRKPGTGGTVFQANAQSGITTLYSFCSELECEDGLNPSAPITVGSDGNFYGTTQGGTLHDSGTAYVVTLAGQHTVLHYFCSLANCADGAGPSSLIQATDGNLYGVAGSGGTGVDCFTPGTCGLVFRMTPQGVTTTVYNFCSELNCADGFAPRDIMQAADGNLYGITGAGGAYNTSNYDGGGTIFKLTLQGALTTLYSFCNVYGCQYGVNAGSLLQATDGNLYGVVGVGEGATCYFAYGCGTVFKLTSSGVFTTLYTFCEQGSETCPDGMFPEGIVQATDGNFYGTTFRGGIRDYGTAFKLSVGLKPFVETVTNSGSVGSSVIILGNNLTDATSVTFNGIPATFTVVSSTEITAAVPVGATTGPVVVTIPGDTLKCNRKFFQVTP
jgi:uncharacterized repeat protein (TIGR03803 family)